MDIAKEIAKKNEMIKKSAAYIKSLSQSLKEATEKIASTEAELVESREEVIKVKEASATITKKIAAEELTGIMVEKGLLDPLKKEAMVEEFVNSPDDIEKLTDMVNKLSGRTTKVGEVYHEHSNKYEGMNSSEQRINAQFDAEKIDSKS